MFITTGIWGQCHIYVFMKKLINCFAAFLVVITCSCCSSGEIIFDLENPAIVDQREDALEIIIKVLSCDQSHLKSYRKVGSRFYVTYSPKFSTLNYSNNGWGLKSIIIPPSVKKIVELDGDYLERIIIPDTVKEIGEGAFGCQDSKLTEITLSSSLTKIPRSAFSGCKRLKRIIIPTSVKIIEDFAFQDCSNLEEIELQPGLESIGYAFHNCKRLKSIKIPSTVKSVDMDAFDGCSRRTVFYWPEGLKYAPNTDNIIYY